MILHKTNGIDYSLFNSTSINHQMININLLKNLYFKTNYVHRGGSLSAFSYARRSYSYSRSCQNSNFISRIFKIAPPADQIARDVKNIKDNFLIPYPKKNFKAYFLFIIFYVDKVRSNTLSASLLYNSFLRPFKLFKMEKNNGRYNEKKNYKNINIFQNLENYNIQKQSFSSLLISNASLGVRITGVKPINFFRVIKKSPTLFGFGNLNLDYLPFETHNQSTHYSFNPEKLILKRFPLIRVLKAAKLTPREKTIKINSYKNSFIDYYKIIIKNKLNYEINFLKRFLKSPLSLFNVFLINLIESNLKLNPDYFQYKNKLETVQFKSLTNHFIWYYKFNKTKVIYILKKVLTLLNYFKNNLPEKTFFNTFCYNYYCLTIRIVKQDKNIPYSLKIIYLNLHSRIWSTFKLLLIRFFYLLINFNCRIFNTDSSSFTAFFIFKTKSIKKYTLSSYYKSKKPINSITQKSIKKGRKDKIEKYLNQGLWQLNKKDHNQNSLNWIFNKYWLSLYYSLIMSENLKGYYFFKSNNINLFKIFFYKMLLTAEMDSNVSYTTFVLESNILNNFKITYKVYLRKIVFKNKKLLNFNPTKRVKNPTEIDSYIILLDKKVVKLGFFYNIQFFNLVKYTVFLTIKRKKKIKYQPIILFQNRN